MTPLQRVELCMAVDEFTVTYAKFLSLKLKIEDGEILEPSDIKALSDLPTVLSRQMDEISRLEELYGYSSVGIPVNANTNFQGFCIRNGELVGDLSYVHRIAFPWYCSFYKGEKTETADFFKFFMASFITHLKDMYMPEAAQVEVANKKQEEPVEVQQKVGRKRFRFLSSFFRKGA